MENIIYKLGHNYFSTLELARQYRDTFYRGGGYIETIEVDRGMNCLKNTYIGRDLIFQYNIESKILKYRWYLERTYVNVNSPKNKYELQRLREDTNRLRLARSGKDSDITVNYCIIMRTDKEIRNYLKRKSTKDDIKEKILKYIDDFSKSDKDIMEIKI